MRFRDGLAEAPPKIVDPADGRRGTEITFWPSPVTFRKVTEFDYDTLEHRLRQLANRNLGVRVLLRDDQHAEKCLEDIHYDGGARVHYIEPTGGRDSNRRQRRREVCALSGNRDSHGIAKRRIAPIETSQRTL